MAVDSQKSFRMYAMGEVVFLCSCDCESDSCIGNPDDLRCILISIRRWGKTRREKDRDVRLWPNKSRKKKITSVNDLKARMCSYVKSLVQTWLFCLKDMR